MKGTESTPYQIDYSVAMTGKVVASSKKRIRFRFGFANSEALEAGAKGVDCRGYEHECTLVWSLTSGKCVVVYDGKEIHYSVGKGGKFQFSWTTKRNDIIEMICHAAPCSSKSDAPVDWRQNDLFINGMSYFELPKIFELGVKPSGHLQAQAVGYQGRNGAFENPGFASPPGQGYGQQVSYGREPVDNTPPVEANLLDFSDPTPVAEQALPITQPETHQYAAPVQTQNNNMASFKAPPAQTPANSFASPPAQPPTANDAYGFAAPAPVPVANDVPDTIPSRERTQSHTSFMSPLTACPTFEEEEQPVAPVKVSEVIIQPAQAGPTPPEQSDERRNPGTMSGAERAVDNLVNLNDITAPVNMQIGKLTLMPSPEEQKKISPPANDKPLWEMQAETKKEPKKEVMNTFTPAHPHQGMDQQQQPMYGQQGNAYSGQQMPTYGQPPAHQAPGMQQQPQYGQGPPPLNNGLYGYGNFQQQQQQQQQAYTNYSY